MNKADWFDVKYIDRFLGVFKKMVERDRLMSVKMMQLIVDFLDTLWIKDTSTDALKSTLEQHRESDGIWNVFSDFSYTIANLDVASLEWKIDSQGLEKLIKVQAFVENIDRIMFERKQSLIAATERVDHLLSNNQQAVAV